MKSLIECLNLDINSSANVCFVGAGGKTTAMFSLAEELAEFGKKVLVTTTTAIYYPQQKEYKINEIFTDIIKHELWIAENLPEGIIVLGSKVNSQGKLVGIPKEVVDKIFYSKKYDFILNEGDGSKRKPLKAPAEYEPVIPVSTTNVVGVIGLDAVDKKIEEVVHRPELYRIVTRTNRKTVHGEDIGRLILSDKGLFKGTNNRMKRCVLLNKADNNYTTKIGEEIIRDLRQDFGNTDSIIVISLSKLMQEKSKRVNHQYE